MLEKLDHFMETHFPWVVQHPTALVVVLALYPVYSVIVATDNAFKAQVVNHNANLADLNRTHDKLFLFGLPAAVFSVNSIFAYKTNVGLQLWLYVTPLATGMMFLALLSAYKLGDTGQPKRLFGLAIFIAAFAIVDLFLYGQWTAVIYGFVASAVCGGVIYATTPIIRSVKHFVASKYTVFLWVSALYSIVVISTFLYALAALLWDEMHV